MLRMRVPPDPGSPGPETSGAPSRRRSPVHAAIPPRARPPSTVSRAGGRRVIRLIAPADDGLIQGDNDLRTPLRKITCPTCVEATLQSRTRRRLDAFRKREGARKMAAHSRLIAEPAPGWRKPRRIWK